MNGVETEWQKVEYLQELAQWLYYHEFPLQDAVDLLQWAVDIILSLQIQLPSWLETAEAEGQDFQGGLSNITTTKSAVVRQ